MAEFYGFVVQGAVIEECYNLGKDERSRDYRRKVCDDFAPVLDCRAMIDVIGQFQCQQITGVQE